MANASNIFRVVKGRENPYSMIANAPVHDVTISFKARGILWLCLTKPQDWKFNAQYLINMSDEDGRSAVYSGLKELEEAGYMFRQQMKHPESGKFLGSVWLVFEIPYPDLGLTEADLIHMALEEFEALDGEQGLPLSGFPHTGNPHTDNPSTEKPSTDNRPLLNTDSTKDLSLPRTEGTNTGADAPQQAGAGSHNPEPLQASLLDPEDTTDFSSPIDRWLQGQLKAEAKAAGRHGPRTFETMAQKQAWRQATSTIIELKGKEEVVRAVSYALRKGRKSRQRVIDTVVVWAENLKHPGKHKRRGGRGGERVMTPDQYASWAKNNLPGHEPQPEPSAPF